MKRLLFICGLVFLASAAQGQTPVALAPVPKPVFTQNGAPLVNGCLFSFGAGGTTPLATYTDSTGSVANTNPIILDANGSPTNAIYLTSAAYKFQLKAFGGTNCASGASVWTADNINAASFLNLPNTWTKTQTFNAGAATPGIVAGNINNVRFVDGTQFSTVQAAINDLPTGAAGGGTVMIPPGSYACPSSIPQGVTLLNTAYNSGVVAPPQIWSKFNGAAFNSFSPGLGSQNMVKFTCASAFTLSDVSQVQILGIVWDMGNVGNFIVKGVAWSNFAIAVVNVPTTLPAISIIGDNSNSFNTTSDHFYFLLTEGGNIGVSIGNTGATFTTLLEFDWIVTLADTQPAGPYVGIAHVANCDSNHIVRHSALTTNVITNFQGEVFNSASAVADTDADSITVDMYDETMNGVPATCTSVLFNPSRGNQITTGDLGCAPVNTIVVTAWAGKTPFTWFGHGANTGTPNVMQSNTVQVGRAYFGFDNSTNLVAGDFAFTGGFGNTPAPSITAIKGTDAAFQLSFTSGGAGLGANPGITLTFHDGTWSLPPVCTVSRGDPSAPTTAWWAPTVPGTATTLILNFIGTPAATTGYIASVICVGKPN